MVQHGPEKLTEILSTLGGPAIQATDIEWAVDLPAGRKLVDWLAAQLCEAEVNSEEPTSITEDMEHGAALRDIALEGEEVEILKHISTPRAAGSSDTISTPIGYFTPSRLKKRAEYIDSETQLLETEITLLKARLRQSKHASQKMSQTIKSLQAAIEKEDSEISRTQDKLAELAVHGDAAISVTVKSALSLLETLGGGPESEANIKSAVTSLSQLASTRSAIVDLHGLEQERIEKAYQKLPSLEEIKADSSRLHTVLTPEFIKAATDAEFLQQLSDICDMLEAGNEDGGLLDLVIDEDDATPNGVEHNLNVFDELEKAWSLDQATILDARGKILDTTISAYNRDIIKPLSTLHKSLATIDKQIKDSEALLGALGLELEEVVDDVRTAQEHSEIEAPKSEEDILDEDLEVRLTRLLKDLKDLRPSDAPPLVLLQKNDIIEEIRMLVQRIQHTQAQQEVWSAELPFQLSTLSSARTPILSKIYEHSLVNTSPPFALPPDIAKLREEAERKGEELGSNVERLQKEVEILMESSRTKRKLGAFVDKWRKDSR